LKWKKLSVCGAIGYKWDGSDNRLYFSIQENNYNSDSLIKFLKSLRKHRNGRKTILVWDSLPAHKSKKMKAFIKTQEWLSIEHLPAYSPDLNPTENVWSNLKGQELANRCENNLKTLKNVSKKGLRRISARKVMLNNFLNHSGLFLTNMLLYYARLSRAWLSTGRTQVGDK
jgi:transposase